MNRIKGCAIWIALLGWVVSGPVFGAGFGIFEQGAKGMGMAGAFTAQADDGSALFHNVGGIAFQEGSLTVGTTLIALGDSSFQGSNPFPGEDSTGEQKNQILYPSHAYWVRPLTQDWVFGFGFNTPFGLTTEWEKPDTWDGRFINNRAELRTFDLNPSIAYKIGPNFGIGFGAIVRFSDVEFERHAGISNPFTGGIVDVADTKLTSDLESGYGWNVGFLHRYNNSFSWGLSYRSSIKIDYGGDTTLTQISTGNAQLDAIVASTLPFGSKVKTESSIDYPDMASLGFLLAVSPTMQIEVDANWTGWSSFDELVLAFPNGELDTDAIPENWEDVYNYRIGFNWDRTATSSWRLGYVYDETPQPAESFGPLLPDSDRSGYTIGYGHQGQRMTFDAALMYLVFDKRSTDVNHDDFNGTYDTNAWLLGLTLAF